MKYNLLAVSALAAGLALPAMGQQITVVNFGGANANAQKKAYYEPFQKSTGIKLVPVEYNGEQAKVKAMVETKKVTWNVVEVESPDVARGCEEGLYEKIDKASITHSAMLLPGTVSECGVGAFVWSTVMAFDPTRFKETPKSWRDFWDVQRFPGKRGLRKGARYNMEIALMADGVNRRDVYTLLATEAGVKRAMAKLEQLKPHIVWWESGAQPPQRLASGETALSTAFNGRIAAANKDGTSQLGIHWGDAIYELDYWVILKGTPRRQQAQAFITFATSEEAQLAFSREIPYGPTHFNAILRYDANRTRPVTGTQLVDLSMSGSDLPSAPGNLRKAVAFDAAFWTKHGDALEKRFAQRMH